MFIIGFPIVKRLGSRKVLEQGLLIELFTNEVLK